VKLSGLLYDARLYVCIQAVVRTHSVIHQYIVVLHIHGHTYVNCTDTLHATGRKIKILIRKTKAQQDRHAKGVSQRGADCDGKKRKDKEEKKS
jgi:hypothetical protein